MNSVVKPNFKEKFVEIYICEFRKQCMEPTQKMPAQAQMQTHLYPNDHYVCQRTSKIITWKIIRKNNIYIYIYI